MNKHVFYNSSDAASLSVCCDVSKRTIKHIPCGRKNIRRGLPKEIFKKNLPQVPLFIPPVVGGHIAGQNSYPWLAALGTRTEAGGIQWFCGGSLISRTLILTAAHCIKIARIWVIIRQRPLPAMPNHQGALMAYMGDVRFPFFFG